MKIKCYGFDCFKCESDRYLIPVNRLPENRPCVHIGWFCRYVTLDESYENGSEAVS